VSVVSAEHNVPLSRPSLPGLRGLEHIGIVVPDLTQATTFFETVLGWPTVFTAGPFFDPEGDSMSRNFDLHPRSRVNQLALVRSPLVNFELFQGSAPDQLLMWPRLLDVGGLHLAVYVDDIGAAVDYLVTNGGESLGGHKPLGGPEEGPGAEFGHVRTPFGLYLEVISYPAGRAYETAADILAFNPAAPDAIAREAIVIA
jgi:catechol 2,3-dioxygenase-like lactoylglutathione lyase family enzyme